MGNDEQTTDDEYLAGENIWLSPREVATMFKTTIGKLAADRCHRTGFPYKKYGAKILYSKAQCEAALKDGWVKV